MKRLYWRPQKASKHGLMIVGNNALTSLTPLQGEVGHLDVSNNAGLLDLAGLEDVVTTNQVVIRFNDALIDLQGLAGVGEALNSLTITHNPALTTLAGLAGPTSVGHVEIVANPQLASLTPLASLHSVSTLMLAQTNTGLPPTFSL